MDAARGEVPWTQQDFDGFRAKIYRYRISTPMDFDKNAKIVVAKT